jgi:hypothetical protein
MFYRSTEHLKAQLEASLRTAADFATLGEYDSGRPVSVSRETPQRVFLFAKVSPRCPHSADAAHACDRQAGRARRGGTVKAAPQPCTWAQEPRD